MRAESVIDTAQSSIHEEPRLPAGPILKSAGGKTRLLPELLARAPSTYQRYLEPFAGGAALFFALRPTTATLSDANADLVAVYRRLQTRPETLIAELEQHRRAHCREHYYRMRACWNAGERSPATFLYLNKTCFNGLWRVNRRGEFNVPMGRYAAPKICDAPGLRAAAAALDGIWVHTCDYRETMRSAQAGDFVYADPPYDGTFTGYTAGGFTDVDQAELAYEVRRCVERDVAVMLSNADTPFVRALYAGMRIDPVSCRRSINSDGRGRGAVGEVIVTAGYPAKEKR
jgi:DNA adenine methylase